MRSWWRSPSSKSSPDDTDVGREQTPKSSSILSRLRSHHRGKKYPPLVDDDQSSIVRMKFETSVGKTPQPQPQSQPLPIPESKHILRNNSNHHHNYYNNNCHNSFKNLSTSAPTNCYNNFRLPSPNGNKERARDRASISQDDGIGFVRLPVGRRNSDVTDLQSYRSRSGRESPDRLYSFNVHMSAPASPYSSSPKHIFSPFGDGGGVGGDMHVAPPCFQVWSAPEMPTNHQSFGHKRRFSFDNNSPPFSPPIMSVFKSSTNERSGPTSPLTASFRHSPAGFNPQPLPLPPLFATAPSAAMCLQQQPRSVVSNVMPGVHEIVPVKSRWQKGKLLGRGTFGAVYVASNRDNGALCAMKEVEISPGDSKSEESIKQLEQEIKVLSNLKHPNIVQYYGSEIVDDRFYIYLEYVHPGSLTKFIQDHCQATNESVVRNFTRHILCGLAYLHSTKTIHRDIKGANLLVDAYGVVKLADFGMAKHLHGQRTNLSIKGTPYWMAPELLQSVTHEGDSKDVAFAIDIWSLGCTVIEMLTGKPPWSEYEAAAAMFKVLKENPPLPDGLSDECQDFLHCCFRRNPSKRPTAAMLLEHPFLRGSCQPPSIPPSSGKRYVDNWHKRSSSSYDQVMLS